MDARLKKLVNRHAAELAAEKEKIEREDAAIIRAALRCYNEALKISSDCGSNPVDALHRLALRAINVALNAGRNQEAAEFRAVTASIEAGFKE